MEQAEKKKKDKGKNMKDSCPEQRVPSGPEELSKWRQVIKDG